MPADRPRSSETVYRILAGASLLALAAAPATWAGDRLPTPVAPPLPVVEPAEPGSSGTPQMAAGTATPRAGRRVEIAPRRTPVFVENVGQADAQALFSLRQGAGTVWVTRTGLVFDPGDAPVRQEFVGANAQATVEPGMKAEGTYNYLIGSDPRLWRTGARTYRMVTYREIWPGVDARVYPLGEGLENVYVVRPGGRPQDIVAAIHGARDLRIDADGSLVIETGSGTIRQRRPVAYQTVDGKRVEVPAAFALRGENAYAFDVGAYRADRPLVIDPVLLFST